MLVGRDKKTILDAGCGSGVYLDFMRSRGERVFGIDFSYDAAKLSGQMNASALSLPFKNESFDVIEFNDGKILERKEGMKMRGWDDFVKKFNSYVPLAIKALKDNKPEAYENYLLLARKSLSSISGNKESYSVSEKINLEIKGIEIDGTSASKDEGWNIQYYTYDSDNPDSYLREYISSGNYNADYSDGYWYIFRVEVISINHICFFSFIGNFYFLGFLRIELLFQHFTSFY